MAILTHINKAPLFSTINEAIAWARLRGLNGYHVHYFKGQKGYMGGVDHSQATDPNSPGATTRTNTNTTRTTTPRVVPPTRTSGGSGGSGGGY